MGQHGAHLGPVGPRWAQCWPHEPCYQGILLISHTAVDLKQGSHQQQRYQRFVDLLLLWSIVCLMTKKWFVHDDVIRMIQWYGVCCFLCDKSEQAVQPMLNHRRIFSVAFNYEQFYNNCSWFIPRHMFGKCTFNITIILPAIFSAMSWSQISLCQYYGAVQQRPR